MVFEIHFKEGENNDSSKLQGYSQKLWYRCYFR